MASRQNTFDTVLDSIVANLETARKESLKAAGSEFGKEQVSPSEFRRRFEGMDSQERQQTVDQMGQKQVLDALMRARENKRA